MLYVTKTLSILCLLFLLSGCDLFKDDVIKKELDSSQFSVDCKLDVDQFANILNENIAPQIRCLGENLNLFIRSVETTKPGYMSRKALEAYIKNNRPEIKPEVLKALKSVYDLNFLMTGDDPEYISKKNVDELIDFAILLNAEMSVTIYPLFTSKSEINFSVHEAQREWVKTSGKKIMEGLNKIFNRNLGNRKRTLNIVEFLQSFSTKTTKKDIEKILKVLFVKKVLFGGDRKFLTHEEVNRRVLVNFSQIIPSVFDIIKLERIKDFNQEKIYDLLERNVRSLGEIVTDPSHGNRDRELFFTIDEVVDVADMFIDKKDFNIRDWKNIILEAKKIFMGGSETNVTGLDFKNLLKHANNVLKTGTVFYRIWARFTPAMESPLPVTVDFSEHRHTYHQEAEELRNFERIVKKYRFFRGKFESAYHTKGIRRNADAVVEIYMFEYLLRQVIRAKGTPNTASLGGYGITRDQLFGVISTLENDLIRLKLILPHRKDSLTDNISLLATLFQYQSDKNGLLDANEATEFVISLLTSMDTADVLMDYYRSKGCHFDTFGRVEPKCFRENFFKSLCEPFSDGKDPNKFYRDGYRQFFPLLFESIGARSCDDLQNTEANLSFLDVSVRAARTCNNYVNDDGSEGEEIYFSHGDLFSTLLVFMHAEVTTLRWDDIYNKGNGNNFMDAPEVDRAYEIYSPALDGFLSDKPALIKGLKKQIYQYLIKFEAVPDEKELSSIWKFTKFLVSFKKKAPAYRRTLAAVLNEIGKQNAKIAASQGKPAFQCNWMRNPDDIPKELTPAPAMTPMTQGDDHSEILENVRRTDQVDEEGEPVFEKKKDFCLTLFNRRFCL